MFRGFDLEQLLVFSKNAVQSVDTIRSVTKHESAVHPGADSGVGQVCSWHHIFCILSLSLRGDSWWNRDVCTKVRAPGRAQSSASRRRDKIMGSNHSALILNQIFDRSRLISACVCGALITRSEKAQYRHLFVCTAAHPLTVGLLRLFPPHVRLYRWTGTRNKLSDINLKLFVYHWQVQAWKVLNRTNDKMEVKYRCF